MMAPRPPNAKTEVLIEDALWIERGWIQRVFNDVSTEHMASLIMDQTDGLWEPHRGFRGRPDFDRLTMRIADEGVESTYGDRKQKIHQRFGSPGSGALRTLREWVRIFERFDANFAYLNLYASGDAGIARHTDTQNMPQLGPEPTIMCLSLGASRRFEMHRNEPEKYGEFVVRTVINDGDLYVMHGRSQAEWRHAVPKDPGAGPRLSITFRHHSLHTNI